MHVCVCLIIPVIICLTMHSHLRLLEFFLRNMHFMLLINYLCVISKRSDAATYPSFLFVA